MAMYVELYEALKPTVGEDAARMIAEVLPPAKDIATRSDIERVLSKMHAENTRTIKWLIGVSLPMWAATWGLLGVLLLRVT